MIQLANIFQNGMTLQRQKPIKLWGFTDCHQQIKVTLNGAVLLDNTTIQGDFTLTLPAQEAKTDAVLTISGSKDRVELTNIDIGEVWIAGGQSNMEFLLRYDAEGDDQIAAANDPHFRFFDVGEYSFPEEAKSTKKDNTGWDKWLPFRPKYAEYFSAVGVYFAKQLRQVLDVPVAIVGCNWGGTTASSWTEERYLASDDQLKTYLDDYAEATKDLVIEEYNRQHDEMLAFLATPEMEAVMQQVLKTGIRTWDILKNLSLYLKIVKNPVPMGPKNQNAPGCLYRTMVKQIAGFGVRGVIWYQGESDDHKPQIYDKLLSAMIRCWRDTWQDELPFCIVQLAPFGKWMGSNGDAYPCLRQKQEIVSKTISGCYLASIMDSGMKKDIHPKHKRPVGQRLALLALGKIYKKDILCDAPEFQSAEVQDGQLLLKFSNSGSGLTIQGKTLGATQILVNGKQLKHYQARTERDTLYICSNRIRHGSAVEVKFAWTGYCQVNLYNSAKLSAKPFCTSLG